MTNRLASVLLGLASCVLSVATTGAQAATDAFRSGAAAGRNDGDVRFQPVTFGDSKGTAYGIAIGDVDKDGVMDIAAARSEGPNLLYFGSHP